MPTDAAATSLPRTADTDRFFDYCLQPYDPLRTSLSGGKWGATFRRRSSARTLL